MNLTALIVDDEPLARERLVRLLSEPYPQMLFLQAGNGVEAIELIDNTPDIVFLDVEMPGLNGLECAKQINQSHPHLPIVFITAYDHYALDAFNVFAAGFLVKPVSRQKLATLLDKLLPTIATNTLEQSHLVSKVGNTIEKVAIADVQYIIAENKYTHAFSQDKSYILDVSLKQLEHDYPQKFVRIHRHTLVDKHLIKKISKHDNQAMLHLRGVPETFEISRRHLKEVKQLLQS